jgi:hypothetical protein
MSILQDTIDKTNGRYVKDSVNVRKTQKDGKDKSTPSMYSPTPEESLCITSILKDFQNGWQTMHLPRPEFNDLSLYQRHIVDMLAFNTYQENDGNPMMEDRLGGWKSNAVRPIIRNKCISIAAHTTARQLVPKIYAYNESNDEQADSARVMGYLVDWAREQAKYPFMALHRTIMSLYSPISWGYSEYTQVYRKVKDGKESDGTWKYKEVIDEDESGFQHLPVSTDQVYFANFYERDVQKQDFIIFRRVISFDKAKAKYSSNPNFKYVTPGVQVIFDDANRGFYNVYDPHMRDQDVEEVIRWRKSTDSKEIMVNGVLMTEAGAENPRADHQYPWDCFYYLPINERCIAGKSLVFAMQSDTTIVNTLYQLWIDGIILNQMPPVVTTGSDKVGIDVMVPGLNLAFSDENVKINPIRVADGQALQATQAGIVKVEASIAESSQDPIQQGQQPSTRGASTAYEISRIEQNAATVLGLTLKFMANSHVIPYGKLLLSDVLQYMTMADAEKITEQGGLLYKTFYVKEPGNTGGKNKIQFDANMPETMTEDEKMDMSFMLLEVQGGMESETTLWKVNPILFREHNYSMAVDSDVLNPRSAELSRAFDLETYDRAINSPVADQEKLFTDLLMGSNPKTARDPKRYVIPPQPQQPSEDMGTRQQPNGGSIAKPNAPIAANGKLPQRMSV